MSGLTLLVSYPKSGNTWVRAFLSSIYSAGEKVDINRLMIQNAANRAQIASLIGIGTSDFCQNEEYRLRSPAFEYLAHRQDIILKVHEAMLPASNPPSLPFNEQSIRSVIYIVRDPRDVAVSFANHLGKTIDEIIRIMANHKYKLESQRDTGRPQMPQLLSTWSNHFVSWVDRPRLSTLVVRYEDMHANPERSFMDILKFLNINVPGEILVRAINACRFETLRAQERERGFIERPPESTKFFHRGVANGWPEILSPGQANRIMADHNSVMQRLGYLTPITPAVVCARPSCDPSHKQRVGPTCEP
jgi:aryl sulfotransferase